MSLYDDDIVTDKTAASGWASGIKMMHSQLAFKKATVTAPKREQQRRVGSTKLPPVIDLKSRRDEDDCNPNSNMGRDKENVRNNIGCLYPISSDLEWKFSNEYDPMWPNDYEKVVKDMRERRDKEEEEKRRQDKEDRDRKRKESRGIPEETGFSRNRNMEEEEEEIERPRRSGAGAAIAPPPSLDGSPPLPMPNRASSFGGMGGSVAAKIMAKYGFKEGQGLGKSQQGIVKALEVEKTSKRGGRIVLENEEVLPPTPSPAMLPPTLPPPSPRIPGQDSKADQNIANILRNPSKVALLRNMVGPGEVDDDLEPEVREECSSKYGNVTQVVIFEIPRAQPEEAVRIFVEFQRVEAAIKAIIDLNGRFFGGRQVTAGFYDYENFKAYKLNEIPN